MCYTVYIYIAKKKPAFMEVYLINDWLNKKSKYHKTSSVTLPETNIAPENRPSQKETSIPAIHFQLLY